MDSKSGSDSMPKEDHRYPTVQALEDLRLNTPTPVPVEPMFSNETKDLMKQIAAGTALAAGAFCIFAISRYRSVPADKFFAKTGPFVKTVEVGRKTFQWPFQQLNVIEMKPTSHHFIGKNMSKEKVPFSLPLTFTVCPMHPEEGPDSLKGFVRYATRLGGMTHSQINGIIEGIVNGETRVFVGGMTIEEIFSDKEMFRRNIVDRVQEDLDQFGLKIQNANIEEIGDTDDNIYFGNLKKKSLEEANTSSRVSVAEARKIGDIGEKEREIITRKQRSILEADAKEMETKQNQKMSDYERELEVTLTSNKREIQMAELNAYNMTETRSIDITSELNRKRQLQELEKLRSEEVVKATADAEAIIKRAEAAAAAMEITANASFYAKCKEADGIKATLTAQADGLEKIYEISKTNPGMASYYLALEKGVFDSDGLFAVLADKQAKAIQDMHPKINIWNTGTTNSSYTDVISNLARTMPPILDVIQEQTGVKLPSFLATNHVEKEA